jgi:hypothetical protein
VFKILFEQVQRVSKDSHSSLALHNKFIDLYLIKLIHHAPALVMSHLEDSGIQCIVMALSQITAQHKDAPLPFMGDVLDLMRESSSIFPVKKAKRRS